MTGSAVDQVGSLARHQRDRAMLAVVLLLVFGFSYSSDVVAAVLEFFGATTRTAWVIGFVGVDAVILLIVARFKRVIDGAEQGPPRRWRTWWIWFGIVAVINTVTGCLPQHHRMWIDLATSVMFAVAMGVLIAVSLNADPLTLVSAGRRAARPADWVHVRAVVPLVVGTFAAYLAATVFDDFFDADTVRVLDPATAAEVDAQDLADRVYTMGTLCESAVSPVFYHQIVVVVPVLLLALGVEVNFFRRTLRDPVLRAVTVTTVSVMAMALVLGLSILPYDGRGCGNVPTYWHEYLTFVVAVQGITIGLATLIWVLTTGRDAGAGEDGDD